MTGGQAMAVVLATTALTNIIGVWVAKVLLNKMRKDKLWRFTISVRYDDMGDFAKELNATNLPFGWSMRGKWVTYDVYAETQNESLIIKELCRKYDAKVFVSESLDY